MDTKDYAFNWNRITSFWLCVFGRLQRARKVWKWKMWVFKSKKRPYETSQRRLPRYNWDCHEACLLWFARWRRQNFNSWWLFHKSKVSFCRLRHRDCRTSIRSSRGINLIFLTKQLKLLKATLAILSIGLNSNIDNETHYYERKSSDPEDGYKMVESFLDKLFELAEQYQETLPTEVRREWESLKEWFKTFKTYTFFKFF